jgi:hypothetical protein
MKRFFVNFGMIKQLLSFFNKSKAEVADSCPDGLCPNCWGEQEYDGVIRKMYVDKQIDVNNHEANHAFIKDFVVKHVEGIHLRKGDDGMQCPTCKRVAK